MSIINGKRLASEIIDDLKNKQHNDKKLAILMVGNRKDSSMYVKLKCRKAKELNIHTIIVKLPFDSDINILLKQINEWNNDRTITGIMVQLPLPEHIDEQLVVESIDQNKDVDGLHPLNLAGIVINKRKPKYICCTAKACIRLIDSVLPINDQPGKFAVVIGRSNIIGLPIAWMLQQRNIDVITCDKDTVNIKYWTQQADIVISATGVAHLITADYIKSGAIVIDVGIAKLSDGRVVGDVKTDEVLKVAGYVSPVPGGVGPMTIAMLFTNVCCV